jgi:hypothetical protein
MREYSLKHEKVLNVDFPLLLLIHINFEDLIY